MAPEILEMAEILAGREGAHLNRILTAANPVPALLEIREEAEDTEDSGALHSLLSHLKHLRTAMAAMVILETGALLGLRIGNQATGVHSRAREMNQNNTVRVGLQTHETSPQMQADMAHRKCLRSHGTSLRTQEDMALHKCRLSRPPSADHLQERETEGMASLAAGKEGRV